MKSKYNNAAKLSLHLAGGRLLRQSINAVQCFAVQCNVVQCSAVDL